jgi:hypothetical protein
MHLEVLVEEPSAKAALDRLLPKGRQGFARSEPVTGFSRGDTGRTGETNDS